MSEETVDGAPVSVLTAVEPGDELELYFDRYNEGYAETPQSPVQTTVLDVTTKELTEEDDLLPGELRSVELTVAEDDETADRYWLEHRTEYDGDGERRSVSNLLYEYQMFSSLSTTGWVGHIDRIVVIERAE